MTERNDLIARLRGCYTVPVNDGAGTLNGSTTFTRMFDVPPINIEAANEIERLAATLRAAWEAGFRLCRSYGDNHAHFDGEQKERHWRAFLAETTHESKLR